MSFKPIDDCTLTDILHLFDLEEVTLEELKKAKKKVLMLHPDKNIGKDTTLHYEYFRKAYFKLVEIHKFLKTDTKQSTEYLSNDQEIDSHREFHKYYVSNGLDKDPNKFSKIFNQVFENVHDKKEDGYGDWLKGNEGIYDSNNIEKSRQSAMQLAIMKSDIQSFNEAEQYSDLKEAHINTVVTMDVDDIYKKQTKYNSIEELQRSRTSDTNGLDLLNKTEEHQRMLHDQHRKQKTESMNMAYDFMKETEKNSNKFKEYCSKFLFIKN